MRVEDLDEQECLQLIELLNDITITNIDDETRSQVIRRCELIQTLVQIGMGRLPIGTDLDTLQAFVDEVWDEDFEDE